MIDSENKKSNRQEKQAPPKGSLTRRKLFQAAAAVAPLGLVGAARNSVLFAKPPDSSPLGVVGQRHANSAFSKSLLDHAAQMTIFDTHEHLFHEDVRMKRKVDVFLLLSHYTDSDLVTAGMSPQGVKNLQNQDMSLEDRWKDLAPYWARIRTTGYGRCMLIAARDLFGVEDINAQTYRSLSERMTAANQPGWYQKVLKEKAHIESSVLDDLTVLNGESLHPDPRFFKIVARLDYFLMCSQRKDLEHLEKVTGVAVPSLSGMEKALEAAVDKRLQEGAAGFKCGIAYGRTLQFDEISKADAERAFNDLFGSAAAGPAPVASEKTLGDYMMDRLMQHAAERHIPVQIHTGMLAGNQIPSPEPILLTLLTYFRNIRRSGLISSTVAILTQANLLPSPRVCRMSTRTFAGCTLSRQARKLLSELIETVPANKILGFGGDFMHVEGAYGHAQMARAVTADVLAEKVEQGYLKEDEAADLLERILYRNGKELFA